jgi:hypothetical protein
LDGRKAEEELKNIKRKAIGTEKRREGRKEGRNE